MRKIFKEMLRIFENFEEITYRRKIFGKFVIRIKIIEIF